MNNKGKRLPASFFQNTDVVHLGRSLIGKVLVSDIDGLRTSGIIVEAEAYRGPDDKACHAYANRRTPRTEVMYQKGGCAYIYICYGMHHLFNVVTGPEEYAHAVLIRALEPLEGLEIMMKRRQMKTNEERITKGPGALSVAMGFDKSLSGHSLVGPESLIYIEDRRIHIDPGLVAAGPRIGVESAGDCANWPWRFYVRKHRNVSAKRI